MLDNFTINKIDFVFTQLYALKFSCDLIQQVKIFLIWTRTRLKINFRPGPGPGPGPGEEKFLDPDPTGSNVHTGRHNQRISKYEVIFIILYVFIY